MLIIKCLVFEKKEKKRLLVRELLLQAEIPGVRSLENNFIFLFFLT